MTTLEHAARQALEALETVITDVKTTPTAYEAQRQAVEALRQALENHESAYQRGYLDGMAKPCIDCADRKLQALKQPKKEPVLQDIEQYRIQMAGICTAAIGYWKETDGIHPDYDTPALRDVAKLYTKYDALYKAQQKQEPVAWISKQSLAEIKDFDATVYGRGGFDDAVPLYAEPPQRKDGCAECGKLTSDGWALYCVKCSEPVREWVGLTDEEIAQGNTESWITQQAFESAVWWAEERLKELNT
jgi:hypothetical protein